MHGRPTGDRAFAVEVMAPPSRSVMTPPASLTRRMPGARSQGIEGYA